MFKAPQPTETATDAQSICATFADGKLFLGYAQHQGKRNYQEDSFGFSNISGNTAMQKGVLAVLADGMGGLANGKNVSETVVSSLLEWFNTKPDTETTGEHLKFVTSQMNQRICDIYCADGRVNAGSTAVEAVIKDGVLHWLCVGDSRLYLKRNGRIFQFNEDHDYLNELLGDAGNHSEGVKSAFENPQKDSLVGCIGNRSFHNFDYSKRGYPLCDGDILVLCSDGVYNALTKDELTSLITENAIESSNNIIFAVNAKNLPGQDNNTVIVMAYKK